MDKVWWEVSSLHIVWDDQLNAHFIFRSWLAPVLLIYIKVVSTSRASNLGTHDCSLNKQPSIRIMPVEACEQYLFGEIRLTGPSRLDLS